MGGAGYTGGELIRLLLWHEAVEILWIQSNSQKNKKISEVHTDLLGDTDMVFVESPTAEADLVFLCVSHGEAASLVQNFSAGTRIIDLSQDHRIAAQKNDFVYGLPEVNRAAIKNAVHIANPGCFATTIQLALVPLAKKNILPAAVHINATTGSTGAGKTLGDTTHFSERNSNLSVYKAFDHQHLAEIYQTLRELQTHIEEPLYFIPQRGSFSRGILASVSMEIAERIEEIKNIYKAFYADEIFVHVSDAPITLKQVVNTNKCVIYLEKHKGQLLVTCATDNLLKGASGQAVQNMNIMYGLPEDMGLRLKASAF